MTVTDKSLKKILDKYDAPTISKPEKLRTFLDSGSMARSGGFEPFFSPSLRREFGVVKISEDMRGSATDKQMEDKCVQFFLRNIGRLTKEIPDWLEFDP
ncbi:MAG: hypothetical protein FJ088_08580, partial [Deltaproteobacteria bacterium]|nr:hypothetical protein [Deltaproteobacteria bacterium]